MVSVRGRVYEYTGAVGDEFPSHERTFTGLGPMPHDDARDRPPRSTGGELIVHTTPDLSHVLMPTIWAAD